MPVSAPGSLGGSSSASASSTDGRQDINNKSLVYARSYRMIPNLRIRPTRYSNPEAKLHVSGQGTGLGLGDTVSPDVPVPEGTPRGGRRPVAAKRSSLEENFLDQPPRRFPIV